MAVYDGVRFNTRNLLEVSGLTVLGVHPQPARRRVASMPLASESSAVASSAFYQERRILVRVQLSGETRAQVESRRGTLMAMLQGREKLLVFPMGGVNVQVKATLEDEVEDQRGGAFLVLDLVFVCSDVILYEQLSTTLLSASGRTSAGYSDALTWGGSAEWQRPVITITYSSITGGTTQSVTLQNSTEGLLLTVNRTWTTGDVLVVDVYNKTVKVNGIEVEWLGSLPRFAPGAGTLVYADSFSNRNFAISVGYRKAWV